MQLSLPVCPLLHCGVFLYCLRRVVIDNSGHSQYSGCTVCWPAPLNAQNEIFFVPNWTTLGRTKTKKSPQLHDHKRVSRPEQTTTSQQAPPTMAQHLDTLNGKCPERFACPQYAERQLLSRRSRGSCGRRRRFGRGRCG